MHSPYSLDLALSDYYLFFSTANSFAGEHFDTVEACKNRLSQFFNNRDADFYERGIVKFPSTCQQIMEQNGAHLI